jgi:hypothetical protein
MQKLILIWELVTENGTFTCTDFRKRQIHKNAIELALYISTCFEVAVSLPFCKKMEGKRCTRSGIERRKEPVLLDLRRPSSQCNNQD